MAQQNFIKWPDTGPP